MSKAPKVKLKDGVSVMAGGKRYRGEIPAALCPPHLKPKKKTKVTDDESA